MEQLPREIETRMARVMERDAVERWWRSAVPLLDDRTPSRSGPKAAMTKSVA